MHCPASFNPIFSILTVSSVIPGSEGNRGNKVPVESLTLPSVPCDQIQFLFKDILHFKVKHKWKYLQNYGFIHLPEVFWSRIPDS